MFFFIIHNGRLAVIFLFTDRQIRIRHIPQCDFFLFKGNNFYFFERKKTEKTTNNAQRRKKMTKVPKSNKTICTSLL